MQAVVESPLRHFSAASLVLAASASADLQIGVVDDLGFHADQSPGSSTASVSSACRRTGSRCRSTPPTPTTIQHQQALDLYVPLATLRGVQVVFSVAPSKARALTTTRMPCSSTRSTSPCSRAPSRRSRTSSSATSRTSRASGSRSSTRRTERLRGRLLPLLAAAYDALKAVDPAIRVVGLGLSPRGNDQPNARTTSRSRPSASCTASARRTADAPDAPDHGRARVPSVSGPRPRQPDEGLPVAERRRPTSTGSSRRSGMRSAGPASRRSAKARSAGRIPFRLDELGWQVGSSPTRPSHVGREASRRRTRRRRRASTPRRSATSPATPRCARFCSSCSATSRSRPLAGRARPRRRFASALVRRRQGHVRRDRRPLPREDALLAPLDHRRRREGALPEEARPAGRRLTLALVANAEEDATRGRRALPRQAPRPPPALDGQGLSVADRPVRDRVRPGRYTFRVTLRAAMNPSRSKSFSAPLRITR